MPKYNKKPPSDFRKETPSLSRIKFKMDFKPRKQEDIPGNPTCGSEETVVAVYLYDRQSQCWEAVNLRNGPAPNHGFKKDLVRKPDPEGLDAFHEDIFGNPTCESEETV